MSRSGIVNPRGSSAGALYTPCFSAGAGRRLARADAEAKVLIPQTVSFPRQG